MDLSFVWDPTKAAANERKQGVSFTEASTVLGDPFSATLSDPDHSGREPRLLLLGRSSAGRLLIVVMTDRRDRIRIISAREMTPSERRRYEEGAYGAD